MPSTGPRLHLFGPQALNIDANLLTSIRDRALRRGDDGLWILKTINELPLFASMFAGVNADVEALSDISRQALEELKTFFESGNLKMDPSSLSNTILSPLVVAAQLLDFMDYLDASDEIKILQDQQNQSKTSLGLCIGMLASFAVSRSSNRKELEENGSTAMRLAMAIGMVVTAQEVKESSNCFSCTWHTEQQEARLRAILDRYSQEETYISVFYDDKRVTVTASKQSAPELQNALSEAGIIHTEVVLRGRFHWKGFKQHASRLVQICDRNPELQFAQVDSGQRTALSDGTGSLHEYAITSILTEPPQWHQQFGGAITKIPLEDSDSQIIVFGPERCVPPSFYRKLQPLITHMSDANRAAVSEPEVNALTPKYGDEAIAVVGMACKVAGANDVNEFWDSLCRGESQHKEVPAERFSFETPHREQDKNRKWFGNFVDGHDTFDHKFFKKSPRETASTDPQQRQILQIAYQAVEQSGYFTKPTKDTNVGCFVGVCSVDYENNVACHAPNAFSATGNLKGFIAGKVSHYFGWTGPGLTIDTACSSSAVAVHQACRAILGGECSTALAGGSHIMTNALWYQNLAGASFLSKTGACKPFDADADGYCRGEGVAAVYLKKLSAAIADGDHIYGVIAASGVQQNQNCTPIVVPNVPSLSDLFQKVVHKANLSPEDISVVEAHGTGTAVGDPAEYGSVRQVLGGAIRKEPLFISSVKGLVGHCECTSGLVSLIKTLLLINKSAIPPQASFKKINPAIHASPSDNMIIPTAMTSWNARFRAALINNYGASGSNASLVVVQAPPTTAPENKDSLNAVKWPFRIDGNDHESIRRRAKAISRFIDQSNPSISDLSFAINRQSNPDLAKSTFFSSASVEEFKKYLKSLDAEESALAPAEVPASRPVILCFGGQTTDFIGLDVELYDRSTILRQYLDEVNAACTEQGVDSIYPAIFQKKSLGDPVKVQTCLFALQYACAKSWIQCGTQPVAVIGHSFGELVSLAVSGVWSLNTALAAIFARSSIVKGSWGNDSGTMIAIDAALDDVQAILKVVNAGCDKAHEVVIACFNGPRQFTLAGESESMQRLADNLSEKPPSAGVRWKRLSVTNAFHSPLVTPLKDELDRATAWLDFQTPEIQVEHATSTSEPPAPASYIYNHMRNPVHFSHAVERLAEKYPSALWLEAGSNSGVTNLVSKVLAGSPSHIYQSVSVLGNDAHSSLAECTLNLWKAGIRTTFWAQNSHQSNQYTPLILPPYQFEQSRHWLEYKNVEKTIVAPAAADAGASVEQPDTILTFLGYQDKKQTHARFRINTSTPSYKHLMAGHVVACAAPILPATVQMGLALEALQTVTPLPPSSVPELSDCENLAPVCTDDSRALNLDITKVDKASWDYLIQSSAIKNPDAMTTHTSGTIVYRSKEHRDTLREFSRHERVTGHDLCKELLKADDADDVIKGRAIYKTFAEIVDYGQEYRGLQHLVGKSRTSAGRVKKARDPAVPFDAHLIDTFCQVAGIWVNCMTDRDPSSMYIAKNVEKWIPSPKASMATPSSDTYDVFAYHHGPVNKGYTSDVFIFDASTKEMVEIILGISYVEVPKASMSKLLKRLTPSAEPTEGILMKASQKVQMQQSMVIDQHSASSIGPRKSKIKKQKSSPSPKSSGPSDLLPKVKTIISELSGISLENIGDQSKLADLGIDSLMAMELTTELEKAFTVSFEVEKLAEVVDMPGVVQSIRDLVGGDATSSSTPDDNDSDSESDISSESDSVFSTDEGAPSPPSHDVTPDEAAGVALQISQVLGIDVGDIDCDIALRDLGVDSLLAMEIRADLVKRFGLLLPEELVVEDVSIKSLEARISAPASLSKTKSTANTVLQSQNPKSSPDESTKAKAGVALPPLSLSETVIKEAFAESKLKTDQFIKEGGCDSYIRDVLPRQTDLCVALAVETLEQSGVSIRNEKAGQVVPLVAHGDEHRHLVNFLYDMLAKDAGLIKKQADVFVRTDTPYRAKTSKAILDDLLAESPNHAQAHNLTYFAGSNLASILAGKTDAVKLIFGSARGRELVSGLYGDWPLNRLFYRQMEDFLARLISKLPTGSGCLRILEMGAGTGGTTQWLLPLLARLNFPVEYTFTDLGPSFVTAARKRFKEYPFMKFCQHDIGKVPAKELQNSQHIIIASNAVHATPSIGESAAKIRQALLPNGALLMLEMTGAFNWTDIVFGLFEGWWLFDDGRSHAAADAARWKRDLNAVNYGFVDWTDGALAENEFEKLILGVNVPVAPQTSAPTNLLTVRGTEEKEIRLAAVEEWVHRKTTDFTGPVQKPNLYNPTAKTILLTGASGSIGNHIVSRLVKDEDVETVICINRRSQEDPTERQVNSLTSRGIELSSRELAKLQVLETDTSKPNLGLSVGDYESLLPKVTHIIHNAWAMSANRPLPGFESQLHAMRNLIDLARDLACHRPMETKIHFQFVSSIAVVGHYPYWKQEAVCPETRMPIDAILTNGYGHAKYICELMLDKTLHEYPDRFRTHAVRIGQVAGSKSSGCWNPIEHLSFLWKSSQKLNRIPALEGILSWTHVDDVADSLVDLVMLDSTQPYPIYNIDNPVRQEWKDMIPILADELGIGRENTIPFDDWIEMVRSLPNSSDAENPAAKLIGFLENNFTRMSCGGLLLDTTKSREHSATMRAVGPVQEAAARRFVRYWKDIKFLS